MPGLIVTPITFSAACQFVAAHHSHHRPPRGHKFSLACWDGLRIVGVCIVGRPVARMLDDGRTLELTRCATDRTRNVASMLYGAARKEARRRACRLVTYTLTSELGTSLIAAGYRRDGPAGGGSWSRPSRPRTDRAPTEIKVRWWA